MTLEELLEACKAQTLCTVIAHHSIQTHCNAERTSVVEWSVTVHNLPESCKLIRAATPEEVLAQITVYLTPKTAEQVAEEAALRLVQARAEVDAAELAKIEADEALQAVRAPRGRENGDGSHRGPSCPSCGCQLPAQGMCSACFDNGGVCPPPMFVSQP